MQKYGLGVPLYRQEQFLAGRGINLSRQAMANWVVQAGKLLEPLFAAMRDQMVAQPILHADETTVQVLHEEGRKPTTKSYMWVYCTGGHSPPLVLFDYEPTRAGRHPKAFLQGFRGYLHVDGYSAYDQLPDVTLVGCWAHARRKFFDTVKNLGKAGQSSPDAAAHTGLAFCKRLFAIEEKCRAMTPQERYAARLKQSVPVLQEMRTWLDEIGTTVLPKSALGKAVAYCCNQWPKLQAFLEDGRLEIDNNKDERAIRPFVTGRKNWLFCNTPAGADASSVLYSIVESAKANNLVPQEYLDYLFHHMPAKGSGTTDDFQALMPWSEAVQAHCAKATAKDRARNKAQQKN